MEEKLGEGCFGAAYKFNTSPNKWYHREHPIAVVKKVGSTRAEAEREIDVLKACNHR